MTGGTVQDDEPRLDERKLAELAAVSTRHGSLLVRVRDTWLQECPRLLEAAASALAAGDAEALEHAAHTWRSGCEHLGVRRLAELGRRLEDAAAAAGDPGEASMLLDAARHEFDEARKLIVAWGNDTS